MKSAVQQLAKKYAQAWLAVYPDEMNIEHLQACKKIATFLKEHRNLPVRLQLSVFSDEEKKEVVKQLFDSYGLPNSLNRLVGLLLDEKRIQLLAYVLEQIALVYAQDEGIQTFIFSSPIPLDDKRCEVLQRFLAAKTGCAIIYEKKVDKSLIAGIRLTSDTLLWEYSLAQQLRALQHALMQ